MGKNLLVIFPGTNYTADMPLLYYARLKYESLGYECIKLRFSIPKNMENLDEIINYVYHDAFVQLQEIDFSQYRDIVFVSKSIGTPVAGMLANNMGISASHIFLTPIPQAFKFIRNSNYVKLVAFGTADKLIDSRSLKNQCEAEHIQYLQIENAGYRNVSGAFCVTVKIRPCRVLISQLI